MALSSNLYALISPRLEKILARTAAPKEPKLPSYGNFRKVTQYAQFLKKVQRRDQRKFLKNRPKYSPYFKGPEVL